MTTINLLPWREESREQRRRAFLGKLFAAALIGIVLVFIWISVAKARLENQHSRNSYLQSNIAEMDKKVAEISELKSKKQEMISRMKVIQDLQGNRAEIVKIFDELVRSVPDGVYLASLEQTADDVKISGFSESNNRISALMRNLDNSNKYEESNLTEVQQDKTLGDQGSVFDLQIKIEKPALGQSEITAP